MERYLLALEAFESETHDIYADYLMGQMVATEGFKDNISARVKQGWETVRRLARQVWEWIKRAGRAIRDAFKRMSEIMRKSRVDYDPEWENVEEFYVPTPDLSKVEKQVQDACKQMEERLLSQLQDIIDMQREMTESARKSQTTFEDIDRMNEELLENHRTRMAEVEEVLKQTRENHEEIDAMLEKNRKDVEDLLASMDSYGYEPATESFNPTKLLGFLKDIDKRVERAITENEQSVGAVTRIIDDAARETDDENVREATKKQGFLSKILNLLGRIGRFLASIPALVQKSMRHANELRKLKIANAKANKAKKTKVKAYNGPDPEIG